VALSALLTVTDRGLYCPPGDFHVDPWLPVERAIITHAHSDHARPGSQHYLTAKAGENILRMRLGTMAAVEGVEYGEPLHINRVQVSLHPAGHILGSTQVRIEFGGQVCVISGDYKVEHDLSCAPFEPIRCHLFVTEATFGLPIYRWRPEREILADIQSWWRANQEASKASIIYAYALGKSQRILAGLDGEAGPIFTHGAVESFNSAYRAAGVRLAATRHVGTAGAGDSWNNALILAPPSAKGSPWTRRFGAAATAFVSGWMQIRGARRRRAVDRGFVLSDHADWPGLIAAIQATGAERVWVTHGYTAILARWLGEHGLAAEIAPTPYEGERDDAAEEIVEGGQP
jgi:putative mRNA 3-end processing factor